MLQYLMRNIEPKIPTRVVIVVKGNVSRERAGAKNDIIKRHCFKNVSAGSF